MLRLPWLRVRTAPRRERWRAVPGREPVQEERATDQEHGERAPGSPREGIMAERARSTEPALAGLVGVLQLRDRSEEHTSELQSLRHLVCRLLLEKKKTN